MAIRPLDDPTWSAQSVVRRFATPRFGVRWGRGLANSISRPWVPISSLLTQMVYILPFLLNYLAGSKKRLRPPVRPSDPDTMINTARESYRSSSGKKLARELVGVVVIDVGWNCLDWLAWWIIDDDEEEEVIVSREVSRSFEGRASDSPRLQLLFKCIKTSMVVVADRPRRCCGATKSNPFPVIYPANFNANPLNI